MSDTPLPGSQPYLLLLEDIDRSAGAANSVTQQRPDPNDPTKTITVTGTPMNAQTLGNLAEGPRGPAGTPGQGVPTGGDTGDILTKTGAADYATGWVSREVLLSATSINLGTADASWGQNPDRYVPDIDINTAKPYKLGPTITSGTLPTGWQLDRTYILQVRIPQRGTASLPFIIFQKLEDEQGARVAYRRGTITGTNINSTPVWESWQLATGGGGSGTVTNDSIGKAQLEFEAGDTEGADRVLALTSTNALKTVPQASGGGATTFKELTDTPNTVTAGEYLRGTAQGTLEFATVPSAPAENRLLPTTGGGGGVTIVDVFTNGAITPQWRRRIIPWDGLANTNNGFEVGDVIRHPNSGANQRLYAVDAAIQPNTAFTAVLPGALRQIYGDGLVSFDFNTNSRVATFTLADGTTLTGTIPAGSSGAVVADDSIGKSKLDFASGTNEGANRVLALTAGDELTTVAQASGGTTFTIPAGEPIELTASNQLVFHEDDITLEIATVNSRDSLQIKNGGVSTAKIADLAITTGKLAADAVDGTKIADNAVNSEHIQSRAITAAKIDDNAVGTNAIANRAVTADKIAQGVIPSVPSYTASGGIELQGVNFSLTSAIQQAITANTNKTSAAATDIIDASLAGNTITFTRRNSTTFTMTIPDTNIWRGTFAQNTLYPQGSLVLFNSRIYAALNNVPANNQQNPNQGTNWAQISINTQAIENISISGTTLTATRQDGTSFNQTISSGGGGVTTFIALNDTPSSFSGQGGKILRVNTGATALIFDDETSGDHITISAPESSWGVNLNNYEPSTGAWRAYEVLTTDPATNNFPDSQPGGMLYVGAFDVAGVNAYFQMFQNVNGLWSRAKPAGGAYGGWSKASNVRADWNAQAGTEAEILNKPTIPAEVPTNQRIPAGGTQGQVITKDTGTDYDVSWQDASGGAELASNAEFDTGTITTKAPTVAQTRGGIDSVRPVLSFWDGTTNPSVDVNTGTLATVTPGSSVLTPYDSTNNRITLSQGNGAANQVSVSWSNALIDWNNFAMAFNVERPTKSDGVVFMAFFGCDPASLPTLPQSQVSTQGFALELSRSGDNAHNLGPGGWTFGLVPYTGAAASNNGRIAIESFHNGARAGLNGTFNYVSLPADPFFTTDEINVVLVRAGKLIKAYAKPSSSAGDAVHYATWRLTQTQQDRVTGAAYGFYGGNNNAAAQNTYLKEVGVGNPDMEMVESGFRVGFPAAAGGGTPADDSIGQDKLDFASGTTETAGRAVVLTSTNELGTAAIPAQLGAGDGIAIALGQIAIANNGVDIAKLEFETGASETAGRFLTIGANGRIDSAPTPSAGVIDEIEFASGNDADRTFPATDGISYYAVTQDLPTGVASGFVRVYRQGTGIGQDLFDPATRRSYYRTSTDAGANWNAWQENVSSIANVTKSQLAQALQNEINQNTAKHGLYEFHANAVGKFRGVSGNPDSSTTIATGTAQFDGGDLYLSRTDVDGNNIGAALDAITSGTITIGGLTGTVTANSANSTRNAISVNWTGNNAPIANDGHIFTLFTGNANITEYGVYTDDTTLEKNGSQEERLQIKDAGVTHTKIATDAVRTPAIQDNAVTKSKIAAESVGKSELDFVASADLSQGRHLVMGAGEAIDTVAAPTPGGGVPADDSIGKNKLDFVSGANESNGRILALTSTDELTTIAAPAQSITGAAFAADALNANYARTGAQLQTHTINLASGKSLLNHHAFEINFLYNHTVQSGGHNFGAQARFTRLIDASVFRGSSGGSPVSFNIITQGSTTAILVISRSSDTAYNIGFNVLSSAGVASAVPTAIIRDVSQLTLTGITYGAPAWFADFPAPPTS